MNMPASFVTMRPDRLTKILERVDALFRGPYGIIPGVTVDVTNHYAAREMGITEAGVERVRPSFDKVRTRAFALAIAGATAAEIAAEIGGSARTARRRVREVVDYSWFLSYLWAPPGPISLDSLSARPKRGRPFRTR